MAKSKNDKEFTTTELYMLLESVGSKVSAMGEVLGGVAETVEGHTARFDTIDRRLERAEIHLDAMKNQLAGVVAKTAVVEDLTQRIDALERSR